MATKTRCTHLFQIVMSQVFFVQRELAASSFTIRSLDLARDVDAVKRIFKMGMRLYCDPLPEGSLVKASWYQYIEKAIADDLSRIEEVYFKPGGHFWVITDKTDGDRVIGCVGVEKLTDTKCELRRMSVDPSARKGGLGTKLVRVVEEFAALGGFRQLILSTGCIMVPAIGLYHRTGFECNELVWESSAEVKSMLDAAGEQFYSVHFQKPVTSNAGRWVWKSFEPHPTVTMAPTYIKQEFPPQQPVASNDFVVQRDLEVSSFSIRTMDLERDLPDVKRIFEQGMRLYCDPLPAGSFLKRSWEGYIKHSIADDLSRIDDVYFKPGGHFWVVTDQRDGDRVVGCVGVEKLSDETCELRRMSVDPVSRKGGLGTKLVRQVEEFAARNGFRQLILSTGSIMVPAVGLYHRTGFECDEVRWSTGKMKQKLDEAGEQLYNVFFRKPISSNLGRWIWESFEPHETITTPPTHIRPGGPVKRAAL